MTDVIEAQISNKKDFLRKIKVNDKIWCVTPSENGTPLYVRGPCIVKHLTECYFDENDSRNRRAGMVTFEEDIKNSFYQRYSTVDITELINQTLGVFTDIESANICFEKCSDAFWGKPSHDIVA